MGEMHELSKLVFNEISLSMIQRNDIDKIIRDWLEEKCSGWYPGLGENFNNLKHHFGLSKRSCKCGACEFVVKNWFFTRIKGTVTPDAFLENGEYCPSCGERLQGAEKTMNEPEFKSFAKEDE